MDAVFADRLCALGRLVAASAQQAPPVRRIAQRRLFAEVGQRKSEIVPVAPNTFASRGEEFQLVFDELPFASEVTLSSK